MLWNENECGKARVMRISIPHTDYERSKITGELGIFLLFRKHDDKLCKMLGPVLSALKTEEAWFQSKTLHGVKSHKTTN
jgi:hypothetical protein